MPRSDSHPPPAVAAPPFAGVAPTLRRLQAGEALFRQGDRSAGLFLLQAGRLRLLRVTPDGAAVPMHTVRAGESFAEASLFSSHYHCDAIALSACEVLQYPKAALLRALRADGEALWAFARDLARHVQGLRTRLEVRQVRAAPQRVLQALKLRCDGDGRWRPDGTWKQFAEEIGLTHEALYRALATLARSGRIMRDGGAVRVVEAGAISTSGKMRTKKNTAPA